MNVSFGLYDNVNAWYVYLNDVHPRIQYYPYAPKSLLLLPRTCIDLLFYRMGLTRLQETEAVLWTIRYYQEQFV